MLFILGPIIGTKCDVRVSHNKHQQVSSESISEVNIFNIDDWDNIKDFLGKSEKINKLTTFSVCKHQFVWKTQTGDLFSVNNKFSMKPYLLNKKLTMCFAGIMQGQARWRQSSHTHTYTHTRPTTHTLPWAPSVDKVCCYKCWLENCRGKKSPSSSGRWDLAEKSLGKAGFIQTPTVCPRGCFAEAVIHLHTYEGRLLTREFRWEFLNSMRQSNVQTSLFLGTYLNLSW